LFSIGVNSYDGVFLSLLLEDTVSHNTQKYDKKSCPLLPIFKTEIMPIISKPIEVASELSILFYKLNLEDDIIDEKTIISKAKKIIFQGLFEKNKKALREYGIDIEIINKNIKKFRELERKCEKNIDILTEPLCCSMGYIYKKVLNEKSGNDKGDIFYKIGYNVAKIMFLIDAVSDFWADRTKKRFNAIENTFEYEDEYLYTEKNREKVISRLQNIFYMCMQNIRESIQRASISENRVLIDNILKLGIYDEFSDALDIFLNKRRKNGRKKRLLCNFRSF